MSRQADEARERKRKGPKTEPKQTVLDFVSFHPTESDKRAIKDAGDPLAVCLTFLADRVDAGLAFTLTSTRTGDALCLVARERRNNFGEGQSLSCFHSDITTLLRSMKYALTCVYPDWPETPVTNVNREFDW